MKNVPNHQPNIISHQIRIWLLRLDIAAHLEGLSHGLGRGFTDRPAAAGAA